MTYQNVIHPDFLNKEKNYPKNKIPGIKEAVSACHVNIDVSQVIISVLGYVVSAPSQTQGSAERVLIDNETR